MDPNPKTIPDVRSLKDAYVLAGRKTSARKIGSTTLCWRSAKGSQVPYPDRAVKADADND